MKSNHYIHKLPFIRKVVIRHTGKGQSVAEDLGRAGEFGGSWVGRVIPGGLWQSTELDRVGAGVEVEAQSVGMFEVAESRVV